ncbi:MAG: hypothetical protein JXA71_12690, partial [Chitinispirillaceae bacterium]|nr:hypothetical protein [Chitinispirillaceae bacterium]
PPDLEMRPPDLKMKPPDLEMRPPDLKMKPPDLEMKPPDLEMKPPNQMMRPSNQTTKACRPNPETLRGNNKAALRNQNPNYLGVTYWAARDMSSRETGKSYIVGATDTVARFCRITCLGTRSSRPFS